MRQHLTRLACAATCVLSFGALGLSAAQAQIPPEAEAPAKEAPAKEAPPPKAEASPAAKGVKAPIKKRRTIRAKARSKAGKITRLNKKKWKAKKSRYPSRRPKADPALMKIPALGQIPFEEGERLVFKMRMLNAEAADVILGVGKRTELMGRYVVPLVGWVRSSDFLSKFYPIDDKVATTVEETSFLPIQTDFTINENGKHMRYISVFDKTEKELRSTRVKVDKKKKEHLLRRQHTPVADMFDGLSMMYALRRMELKAGMKFAFYAWDGHRERFVEMQVAGQERVWTPAGWFETMKVDIQTTITGGFVKKADLDKPTQKGSIWIGLDPNRTPVKLASPTKLGEASAILVKRYKEKV